MKILFLDNDGVICLSDNWNTRQKKWARWRSQNPQSSKYLPDAPVNIRFDDFDKKAIRILNEIIIETDCEIVVSSDWRAHATLKELGDYYLHQGIVKRPIDMTGNTLSKDTKFWDPKTDLEETRSAEILEWLAGHPEVTNWVAVDDLDMSERFDSDGNYMWGLKNFVITKSSKFGIKQAGIKESIINFLV